jgi:hypothetical protein
VKRNPWYGEDYLAAAGLCLFAAGFSMAAGLVLWRLWQAALVP